MTPESIRLGNRRARHLWLAAQGLSETPTGPLDLIGTIERLGFVQLDTIQVVARAHHHILWSRNQHYREKMLDSLMSEKRLIFEHFTHDASVIPMAYLPVWQRQFERMKTRIEGSSWWTRLPDAANRAAIRARIADEGPLSTKHFETAAGRPKAMWHRPPHKMALDYMWYTGELATCHRRNFVKYYDLAERVFPADLREAAMPDSDRVDWLCRGALDRLGFGTLGEIRKFWEAMDAAEAKDWAAGVSDLVPLEVETADGGCFAALGPPDIGMRIKALSPPTSRLRILNPFDPLIRDRVRLKRLFGFDYRVEMFVPAAKRKWGYYVFPLLEGDRFVGRVEAKAERAKRTLTVSRIWHEPGIRWGPQRWAKLDAEVARMARFAGTPNVVWKHERN